MQQLLTYEDSNSAQWYTRICCFWVKSMGNAAGFLVHPWGTSPRNFRRWFPGYGPLPRLYAPWWPRPDGPVAMALHQPCWRRQSLPFFAPDFIWLKKFDQTPRLGSLQWGLGPVPVHASGAVAATIWWWSPLSRQSGWSIVAESCSTTCPKTSKNHHLSQSTKTVLYDPGSRNATPKFDCKILWKLAASYSRPIVSYSRWLKACLLHKNPLIIIFIMLQERFPKRRA